ncbi:hypothetical protein AgCh_035330 [Apium graveolens]
MNVPVQDKPRYRNRKGEITTNVLAAVTPNLQFTYVLTGWEGSAADGRVLKDALSRKNELKVPKDAGYTNGEGFLTPFRRVKYHRNEWKEGYQPICAKEAEISSDSCEFDSDMEGGTNEEVAVDVEVESTDSLVERGAGKNKRKWTEYEDEKLVEALLELVNTGKFKADNGFKPGYTVHPGAAKWKSTPLPYFKELSIIFGKDRATGNMAENLEDVVEELNTEVVDELSLHEDMQRSTHSDGSTSKKRKKGNVDLLLEAVYAASDRIANQFEASTKFLIAAEEDMILEKSS